MEGIFFVEMWLASLNLWFVDCRPRHLKKMNYEGVSDDELAPVAGNQRAVEPYISSFLLSRRPLGLLEVDCDDRGLVASSMITSFHSPHYLNSWN